MNHKKMKIEINESQPLDDVVMELERLGFCYNCGCDDVDAKMVTANNHFMQYDIYNHVTDWEINTTITELKAMK